MSKIGVFASLPIPEYSEIRLWGILNLLKFRKNNAGLQGLKDYRHLSRLAYTSGSLIASMAAVQMLKDEEYLAKTLNIKNWKPIPVKQLDVFKRVAWAWVGRLKKHKCTFSII